YRGAEALGVAALPVAPAAEVLPGLGERRGQARHGLLDQHLGLAGHGLRVVDEPQLELAPAIADALGVGLAPELRDGRRSDGSRLHCLLFGGFADDGTVVG